MRPGSSLICHSQLIEFPRDLAVTLSLNDKLMEYPSDDLASSSEPVCSRTRSVCSDLCSPFISRHFERAFASTSSLRSPKVSGPPTDIRDSLSGPDLCALLQKAHGYTPPPLRVHIFYDILKQKASVVIKFVPRNRRRECLFSLADELVMRAFVGVRKSDPSAAAIGAYAQEKSLSIVRTYADEGPAD